MIKLKIEVTGKNAQGVSVVKKLHVFEADLQCSEGGEIDVAEMLCEHMETLAGDLRQAADLARRGVLIRDLLLPVVRP